MLNLLDCSRVQFSLEDSLTVKIAGCNTENPLHKQLPWVPEVFFVCLRDFLDHNRNLATKIRKEKNRLMNTSTRKQSAANPKTS